MLANLVLGLLLATLPTTTRAAVPAAVAGFMAYVDSIAAARHGARGDLVRDRYRDSIATIYPGSVADQDLEALLFATITAAGLANDRDIAGDARAVFDEIESRSLPAQRYRADMQWLYLTLRDFDAARAFHARYRDDDALGPIPEISPAPGFDASKRSILTADGTGGMQRRNFAPGHADFVLVVASPLCHFSRDAMAAILADPALHAYFAEHSHWLAPNSLRLDPALLATWDTMFPEYPLMLVDDIGTWPEIDYWSTPTFYIFVQGRIVRTIRGWPAGGRAAELKRALGIRQTGR